eukprot:gene5967-11323_t
MASKVFNVRSQDDREMAMITDNRAAEMSVRVGAVLGVHCSHPGKFKRQSHGQMDNGTMRNNGKCGNNGSFKMGTKSWDSNRRMRFPVGGSPRLRTSGAGEDRLPGIPTESAGWPPTEKSGGHARLQDENLIGVRCERCCRPVDQDHQSLPTSNFDNLTSKATVHNVYAPPSISRHCPVRAKHTEKSSRCSVMDEGEFGSEWSKRA